MRKDDGLGVHELGRFSDFDPFRAEQLSTLLGFITKSAPLGTFAIPDRWNNQVANGLGQRRRSQVHIRPFRDKLWLGARR